MGIERAAAAALLGTAALAAGCGSYRVEYHERPAYYRAAGVKTDGRVTLEDGTVLVFHTRDTAGTAQRLSSEVPEAERFRIREERDNGDVVLRAMLPQHVLANTLTCLRNQEYELLWDQVIAERTKRNYELREQGYKEFEAYFSSNRIELAAMLTRMLLGLPRGESFMETVGGGIVRFYFHPRVATEFDFKTAEVIAEGGGLRLLLIQ